jgi:hypothetical protein
MTAEDIIDIMKPLKAGSFYTIVIEKNIKTKDGRIVLKRTTAQGMAKVEYSNRREVREAIEEGVREAPELPKWAEIVMLEDIKFWRHTEKGSMYFPVVLSGNSPTSEFIVNDEVVEPDTLNLYAADKPKPRNVKEGQVPFFTASIENIVRIN